MRMVTKMNGKLVKTVGIIAVLTIMLPQVINANNFKETNLDDSLITRPKTGYLYVHDREVTPLGGRITVIIGQITIAAHSRRDIVFDKVEFWIGREIKNRAVRPPYEWTWNERTIGWQIIRIIAYKGDRTIADELTAFVYNIGRTS